MRLLAGALLLILAAVAPSLAQPDAMSVVFHGEHRFSLDDRPEFADPDFDDSGWRRVAAPADWPDLGVPFNAEIGWYRITFDLPSEPRFDHPVFIYYPRMTDEVFLNGEEIGGEGRISHIGAFWRVRVPPNRTRTYKIPPSLLRYGETNVLAIRIQHLRVAEVGGIGEGRFGIYEFGDVFEEISATRTRQWFMDGIYTGIGLVLVCIAIPVLIFGFRTHLTISFAAMAVFYFVSNVRWSHAFVEAFDIPFALNEIVDRSDPMTAVLMLEVVSALLVYPLGRLGRTGQILMVISLLPPLFTSTAFGQFWFDYALYGMVLSIMIGTVWTIMACISAIRRGLVRGWVMMIVLLATVEIPVILMFLNPSSDFVVMEGDRMTASLTTAFILCLAVMASLEVLRIERERASANERALGAQADERARIARDMHDGVGQWLGALKLRLQMTQEKVVQSDHAAREGLSDALDDVDGLIDDTRRIAHNLSPAYVHTFGLPEALRKYAEEIEEDFGVHVDLTIGSEIDLPGTYQDHLFRIAQEAIRNAIRHGKAENVAITLAKEGGTSAFSIVDDGAGIGETIPESFSLGFKSMRDRVKMMNGDITMENVEGGGFRIDIAI